MELKEIIGGFYTQLRVFNPNARKLIFANLLFGLFNPFYLIFANTFIFAHTHGDLYFNLIFNLFNFAGIITGFILNGFILQIRHVKDQMILGASLLFVSLAALFLVPPQYLSSGVLLFFGLAIGTTNGIYWSSRNYLTVVNTSDANRNFFAGLDFILVSVGRIITPLLIGFYIGEGVRLGLFSPTVAYQSVLVLALLLVIYIAITIAPRKYATVKPGRFLYFRYSKLWLQARWFVITLGFFQGAFMALPPILILKYVGNETAVGIISSVSYCVAIVLVFWVSKRTDYRHRSAILRYGAWFLLGGSVLFSVMLHFNSFWATTVMMVAFFISEPVLNFPFRASFMKAIDELKHKEKRDPYAYIVDLEMFTAIGRVLGVAIFMVLYLTIPIEIALPLFMLLTAGLQFFNIRFSKRINGC